MTSTNSTQQLDFHKEMVELISEFEDLYEAHVKLERKADSDTLLIQSLQTQLQESEKKASFWQEETKKLEATYNALESSTRKVCNDSIALISVKKEASVVKSVFLTEREELLGKIIDLEESIRLKEIQFKQEKSELEKQYEHKYAVLEKISNENTQKSNLKVHQLTQKNQMLSEELARIQESTTAQNQEIFRRKWQAAVANLAAEQELHAKN